MFVAAGNLGLNTDTECLAFPTCFDNITNLYSVGAVDAIGVRLEKSNYGSRIRYMYSAENPLDNGFVPATSFAAPRALADFILSLEQIVLKDSQ
jgi:hypothetical protein